MTTSANHKRSTKPMILVTGATGLIGSRLCRSLTSNFLVFGLDIAEPDPPIEGVEWIECDLTEDDSVRAALDRVAKQAGSSIASVVHLAAYYDFSGEPSEMYQKLTVDGTRRLLRSLHKFEVEQFVFSSSLLVMEPVEEEEVLTERSPTEGEWAYPQSKLAAEQVIREEHGNIPAVILRIAGVYDEQGHSIPISQQIARIYEESLESRFFPGDMDHGQPFIHLDDLLDCIRKVIDRRGDLDPLEVFLIAESEVMSYRNLQDRIGTLVHGDRWFTMRIPKAVAKAGAWVKEKLTSEDPFIKPWMVDLADDHYPVNITKAQQRLGWQPRHRLHDTLEEMIDRLHNNPTEWYEINGLGEPPEEKLGAVVVDSVGVDAPSKGQEDDERTGN